MRKAREHKCRIIANRHIAKSNAKHNVDAPCISIHSQGRVEYAKAIEMMGKWTLEQDFTGHSPCSGARVWLEGVRENVKIINT